MNDYQLAMLFPPLPIELKIQGYSYAEIMEQVEEKIKKLTPTPRKDFKDSDDFVYIAYDKFVFADVGGGYVIYNANDDSIKKLTEERLYLIVSDSYSSSYTLNTLGVELINKVVYVYFLKPLNSFKELSVAKEELTNILTTTDDSIETISLTSDKSIIMFTTPVDDKNGIYRIVLKDKLEDMSIDDIIIMMNEKVKNECNSKGKDKV